MGKRLILVSILALFGALCSEEIECCSCFYEEQNVCKYTYSVYGDFLYWQPTVNGLPFAVEGTIETIGDPPIGDFFSNDQIYESKFSYSPGFRLGAGWIFDAGWDLNLDWTRLYSSASKHLTASDTNVINESFFFFPFSVDALAANQLIHLNELVGEFTKTISIGTHFTSSISFGALGAWIDQKLKIDSNGIINGTIPTNHHVTLKNDFSGAGLRISVSSEYSLRKWFSVYGKCGISLIYGTFDVSQKDILATDDPIIGTLLKQGGSNPSAVVSEWDLRVGFKGSYTFHWVELFGHVGYEFAIWPNQLRIFRTFNNTDGTSFPLLGRGDVGFQGLSAGLGLAF